MQCNPQLWNLNSTLRFHPRSSTARPWKMMGQEDDPFLIGIPGVIFRVKLPVKTSREFFFQKKPMGFHGNFRLVKLHLPIFTIHPWIPWIFPRSGLKQSASGWQHLRLAATALRPWGGEPWESPAAWDERVPWCPEHLDIKDYGSPPFFGGRSQKLVIFTVRQNPQTLRNLGILLWCWRLNWWPGCFFNIRGMCSCMSGGFFTMARGARWIWFLKLWSLWSLASASNGSKSVVS